MKRLLFAVMILCALLLVGCQSNDAATDTDTRTESGSNMNTEPCGEDNTVYETERQAESEAPTDTETVTETDTEPETQPRRELTAEEHRAEIERKTYGGKVVIGGYTSPGDANVTETAFVNLLAGGINTMVTGNEFYGQVMISNTLNIADRLGMDITIQMYGQIYSAKDLVQKLKLSAGHPCVKYLYLMDEPLPEQFSGLAKKTTEIRKAYPDAQWKIGSNMFPAAVLDNVGGWYTCSRNYIDRTKSDYLCFDFYPWRMGPSYVDVYLATVVMEKRVCDEFGVEMFAFLQTASWDDAVQPTEGQLRFQTNATLALGADGLYCFTCCDSTDKLRSIILPDGTPDEYYYVCSRVFNDVHAMKGVFLPYSTEKMLVIGEPQYYSAMAAKDEDTVTEEPSYGSIKNVSGDRVMIGCMKNADGKEGFYVVNSDCENENVITLTFDKEHTFQLWNANGLENMGTQNALTVDLVPGGACFIALDLSLDSYDYDEPQNQDVERHAAPTVKQGDLVFDLAFDSDGKMTNRADNGVGIKDFCTATYAEIDGVPAINAYDVYTTDAVGVAGCGVTVEMYVYLDEKADQNWVTLFYDPFSNNNLHRIFEKSGKEYVGSLYQGSYSEADNVVEGADNVKAILPTGEWLHIVSVVSGDGQYLYVNGKQVLSAHNPHYCPSADNFIFADANKACYLNTARVYAYAATPEQVSDMYASVRTAQ